jgi:cob(I)alamin adenosyltransferase
VALNRQQKIDENILKYINRLSDYLFIKAIEQIKELSSIVDRIGTSVIPQ